ncbi:hypothetical protein EGW08_003377 [Elysia chlorotica]|uniref:Integrase zinc-binding domain-containing protein n=1 Tax=Elysia chlorotica TaxID=188477 RepID=A0A3S0ZX22_ELYCH|nr:hypothetical protein EGW08_003377 [Elysia chlorotica]
MRTSLLPYGAALLVALCLVSGATAARKNWVLLIAGSNGYGNYRHQADVCHAYQIAHANGIPDEQIVVMMYDDIANNEYNPVQGNIINRPGGPNVYPGVPKDYTGDDVNAETFLAVLQGNKEKVKSLLGGREGKVIESGPDDYVFVNFADHGGPGILVDHLFNFVDELPVTATDIAKETLKDPLLKQVFNFAARGWPSKPSDDVRAFTARKHEISIDNGCLLWGTRVIIPTSLRSRVLDILHETHIGISRMKAQARSWVWWPLLDYDIERLAKTGAICEQYQKSPPKAPLHPWDWPQQPWSRVHMDFAGPFLGKMFLIIIDAHSKWIDIKIMSKITASDTILELREVFSTFGLPEDSNESKSDQPGEGKENLSADNGCLEGINDNSSILIEDAQNEYIPSEVQLTGVNVHPKTNECADESVNAGQMSSKSVEIKPRRSGRIRKEPDRLVIQ